MGFRSSVSGTRAETKYIFMSQLPYIYSVSAVFSSLSLGLLPERSATLMVYEDVVQIVSGFQGMLNI